MTIRQRRFWPPSVLGTGVKGSRRLLGVSCSTLQLSLSQSDFVLVNRKNIVEPATLQQLQESPLHARQWPDINDINGWPFGIAVHWACF